MLEKFKIFQRTQKLYTVPQRITRLKRRIYGLLIGLGVLISSFIIIFIIESNRLSNYYYNNISETRINNTGIQRKNFVNLYFSMAYQDLHDFHKELERTDLSDGNGNVDEAKLFAALDASEAMPYFLEGVGVIYNNSAVFSTTNQFALPNLTINRNMVLLGSDIHNENDDNLYFISKVHDELKGITGHIGYMKKSSFVTKIETEVYDRQSSTIILNKNGDIICVSSLEHEWRFNNFYGKCFTNLNDAMKEWVSDADYNRYLAYMEDSSQIIFNAGNDDRDGMFYKVELSLGDETSNYYLLFMAPRGLLTIQAVELTKISLIAFYSSVLIGTIFVYTLTVLLVINYTKRKREMAFHLDTGLYKEDAFFLDTQAILLQNPQSKFGLIYLNIKNFSRINSYFGTNAGDKVLDEVSIVLNDALNKKANEIAGYQHADKYMLLLPGDIDDVLYKLQVINENLVSHNYDYGQKLNFSYGIKITDAQYAIDLRGEFDCAKYSENNSKKSEIFNIYDQDMIAHKNEVEDINGRFEEALQNEEFEVFLQLKWSLTKNDWAGAEALCRWRDPIKGLISPGKFIPLFEENGKIIKLDIYMFENTCKILRKMLDNGERCVPISFNLSKRNFQDLTFIEKYHEIIEKYNIPHDLIEVEITEGLLVDNVDTFTSFIKIFHENDFSISMDDFGAGYSSLNMIHELDFDVIKIDAKFFRGGFDEANQIIVSSIINLCHQLNKIVVAEGVENTNEVEFLKKAGCDIVQGYYFAKPLPIDEFKELLFSKPKNK